MKSHWFLSWVVAAALASCSCGQSEYDRLVSHRIKELKQPDVKWQEFPSTVFGYTLEVPGEPKVEKNQSADGHTIVEIVSVDVGPTAYRVTYSRDPSRKSETELREAIERSYVDLGYTLKNKSADFRLGGEPALLYSFEKPDSFDRARVGLLVTGTTDSCALAIVGPEISDQDADRFFESFSFPH
jgi:hypothetical protein